MTQIRGDRPKLNRSVICFDQERRLRNDLASGTGTVQGVWATETPSLNLCERVCAFVGGCMEAQLPKKLTHDQKEVTSHLASSVSTKTSPSHMPRPAVIYTNKTHFCINTLTNSTNLSTGRASHYGCTYSFICYGPLCNLDLFKTVGVTSDKFP